MTARSRNFHSLLRHLAIPALGCLVGCGLGRGAIEGRVVAPDGSPLAGAQVTVLGADPNLLVAGLERSKWTTTDASGRFKVRLPAGSFELAITHADLGGCNTGRINLGRGEGFVCPMPLALSHGACAVTGQVDAPEGPRDAVVGFLPIDPSFRPRFDGVLVTRAQAGQFRVALPQGLYRWFALAPGCTCAEAWAEVQGASMTLRARLRPPSVPAPRIVKTCLKRAALPLATASPDGDPADLRPFLATFGQARLIGLGEATHGTHEFIQLKHRLLRAMSADPGPLLLGLEMNQAAGFALDDWAVTGQGEPWSSLPPTLLTEDLRDLLLWVRARNQASGTAAAIRLGGFDVHGPRAPYEWALSFLRQVDAAEASFLATHLHDLVGAPWQGPPQAPGTVEAWRAALERLQHQARQRRQRWLARSSPVAFDRYQRCLVLLEQGTRLLEGGVQRVSTREKAMADNVHWLLSAAAPDARVVLWAHNGHISKSPTGRAGFAPMGWYLAQTLGAAYLPIGLVFHEGGFAGVTAGQPGAHTVAPMAADTLGRALVASGLPLLALDLRQLPAHGRVG